jgi:hypothetical protein
MKLGKRERALRRELMRYKEQCRNRHLAVVHPGMNAAASGNVASSLKDFSPSQSARPRLPAGWNSSKARSIAARELGKTYS